MALGGIRCHLRYPDFQNFPGGGGMPPDPASQKLPTAALTVTIICELETPTEKS